MDWVVGERVLVEAMRKIILALALFAVAIPAHAQDANLAGEPAATETTEAEEVHSENAAKRRTAKVLAGVLIGVGSALAVADAKTDNEAVTWATGLSYTGAAVATLWEIVLKRNDSRQQSLAVAGQSVHYKIRW